MSYIIRYRRPETPWSVGKMTTSNESEAVKMKKRLEALGYRIIEHSTPPDPVGTT